MKLTFNVDDLEVSATDGSVTFTNGTASVTVPAEHMRRIMDFFMYARELVPAPQ